MDQWDASAWAMTEFGGASLGHRARTKRLVQIAASLIETPASSIPKAIRDPAQAKAAYRFMSNPKVTAEGILSGHAATTAQRCLEHRVVLVVEDTTTLTFHTRAGVIGLGPINDRATTRGFLAHSALAITREKHEVLGVMGQHTWVRSKEKKPANETGKERKKRPRESENWSDSPRHTASVIEQAARDAKRTPPRVIEVFDREGDIFEAMEALDEIGHSFVIRAQRDRLLEDGEHYSLTEVRNAPVVTTKTVNVRARAGQPARVAVLAIRAMAVSLKPPRNRDRKGDCLGVNLVLAEELDPPQGSTRLSWYLITREPVVTHEDVLQVVKDYEARWIVEEFHMGLKTGCACEDRQMESAHALKNFLALATPMACQLLQLRDAARKDTPVEQCTMLGRSEMAVLQGLRPRAMAKVTTARQLMRVVANFGGFLNRNSDPDPGWRTLWRGFEEIKTAAQGYELRERIDTERRRAPRGQREPLP